jgi:hypothetical protein
MYPLDKYLDLSSLSKYKEDSITVYIGMDTIMEKFGPLITGGIGMAKGMFSPGMYDPGMDPAMAGTIEKVLDFYFTLVIKIVDIAKNINNLTYGAAVNAEGAEIKSAADVMPDNYVADFVNAAGSGGNIKEYAKYLPDNYMVTMLGNIEPEAVKMLGLGMLDMFADASFFDTADLNAVKKVSSEMYDAMGKRTAAAFNIDFDMGLLEGISGDVTMQNPADIKSMLAEAVKIDLITVYELKDSVVFRNSMREMINGGLVSKLVNNFYRELGMRLSVSMREKVVEKGFEYDIVSYAFDMSEFIKNMSGGDLEDKFQMQLMNEMLSAVMEKFDVYIHYTDNQCFMTMGNPEFLKSIVENNSYTEGNIAESEAFKESLEEIPDDSNYFFQLSIAGLVDLFTSTVSGERLNSLKISDTTGLVMYGRFSDNKMEGTVKYPSNEIAGFVSNIGMLMTLEM